MLDKNLELLQGCQELEGWEGFRDEVYLDSENIETIGIGRNLEIFPLDPDELEADGTYSHLNATAWAFERLTEFRRAMIIRNPWVMDQPPEIRIILTDMAYNMGLHGLMTFKNMIKHMRCREYLCAAAELKDSRYFKQTGQRSKYHYNTLGKLATQCSP